MCTSQQPPVDQTGEKNDILLLLINFRVLRPKQIDH